MPNILTKKHSIMKLYTCPKCGNKMTDAAPNFCPNCGCPSTDFTQSEFEQENESKSQKKKKDTEDKKEKKGCSSLGCISTTLIALLIGFVIVSILPSDDSKENYNDNSTLHQILAKNYFVDMCIKKRMHDAKSYEEVSYDVNFNNATNVYEVKVTFRGKNAFGAYVLSTYHGNVKFTDDEHVQCIITSTE